ncbi:MAG: energy-coupling factor ABC transporter ATP-binding protein [Luteibaculaceae bacterium]
MSLLVKNLSFSYPKAKRDTGITNISFSVASGSMLALAGESGSGKSSLILNLAGLLQPSEGSIWFNGERILGPEEKLIPGHPHITLVTQQFTLDKFTRVNETLQRIVEREPKEVQELKIKEILAIFGISNLRYEKPSQLSGGQQKRVALAASLIKFPKLLLLDEPFSGLDANTRFQLFNFIKQKQQEEGFTVVYASHEPDEVLFFCHELCILKSGLLNFFGPPHEAVLNPKSYYQASVLGPIVSHAERFFRISSLVFNPTPTGDFAIVNCQYFEPERFFCTASNGQSNCFFFHPSALVIGTIGTVKQNSFNGWEF